MRAGTHRSQARPLLTYEQWPHSLPVFMSSNLGTTVEEKNELVLERIILYGNKATTEGWKRKILWPHGVSDHMSDALKDFIGAVK